MQADPIAIACRDGCKRTVAEDQLESTGWTFLAIARRWRCPACSRALIEVNEPATTEGE